MFWKMHVITRPAIGDERCRQPAMLGRNITGKIAPDMVAAEMFFLLYQDNFQFRSLPRHRKRDQAASQPAADNGKVAFNRVGCSRCHAQALGL